MTKVLYLVMSGEEAPTRFDIAIYSAMRLHEEKSFESIKVLFFGDSEALLTNATGRRGENLKKLIDWGGHRFCLRRCSKEQKYCS